MNENAPQFTSPEEEIAFLRQQIAEKERALLDRAPDADRAELAAAAKEALHEYGTFTPNAILAREHQFSDATLSATVASVESTIEPTEEIIRVAQEDGIRNALSVMEQAKNAHMTDDVHARLIELIKEGVQVQGLKEGVPPWQVLHMTLFEVELPEFVEKDEATHQLNVLVGMMEQFCAGMQSVAKPGSNEHYVIEIASPAESNEIIFYVAVPNEYIDLFTKHVHSLYPEARLIEQRHDYNIFFENGVSQISMAGLKKHPIYPLKRDEDFDSDPLAVILNAFSKIEKNVAGASLQFVVRAAPPRYQSEYQEVIKRVRDGMKPKEAIGRISFSGDMWYAMKELFTVNEKKDSAQLPSADVDQIAVEQFTNKVSSTLNEVIIRAAVSAHQEAQVHKILSEIESAFSQFENTQGNALVFRRLQGTAKESQTKAYSFREFAPHYALTLSTSELATLIHFPGAGIGSSPQFRQSHSNTAAAPAELPEAGTQLGVNDHRGSTQEIFVTEKDRMRHLYVVGQTGTGKSVFMKNLIIQDIQDGAGVCMIDPHGTDIQDVVASVPPERHKDIIYFDPSNMEDVIGLNMLEYDPERPEQKTFVVNELFSIFQRLYSAVPESMGPMFEQYFRNATLLVMEDPESGNTMMDISRVMSDAAYRRHKLERATNPVVVQFWQEIATKAGGEASLENIVPYIVSKFDVFTANDYVRPIIGQQQSTFNFRKIMDERKILLVNLSKGRLGEINANLIGMIVVGKLLMAALSRVDSDPKDLAPFFLHIDEFQNVSTDSIEAILSEARKYKLGLTVAHQFIAQLSDGIRDAVFGNVGSLVAFRVGSEDAEFLQHQFTPVFGASDLMNIPNYNAYVRILAEGVPQKPFSIKTLLLPDVDTSLAPELIAASLKAYGRPRAEVEAEIRARYHK